MKEESSFGYSLSADVIRSLAIVGVVTIHIANAVYTRIDFFGGTMWWIAIILDSFSRSSIPFFLMLSGYLILRKNENLEKSLKRIGIRIVIPLIFWFIFYSWYGNGLPSIHGIGWQLIPKMFFVETYHLYYLVIVMGLYFAAPFISSYIKSISESSKQFLMKVLLIFGVSMLGFQYFFHGCSTENLFTKWVPFVSLFVAGYILGEKVGTLNKYKLFIGYIFGAITTIVFNYIHYALLINKINLFQPNGCLSNYTDHYLSVNVVIMSLCGFLLLLGGSYGYIKRNIIVSRFIKSFAAMSFGIYLIHPFVARFLEMQFNLAVDFSPLPLGIIVFLRLFLVLMISYIITFIGVKIPLIKYVFGGR